MAQKIIAKIPQEQLQKDLAKYRQRALEMGATDAKVIGTDDIVIDERVLAKCTYPKCPGYGTNANCPPYAMDIDQIRKVVNNFKYAIFVKLEVPPKKSLVKRLSRRI
jgi:predicted metal-binding protein